MYQLNLGSESFKVNHAVAYNIFNLLTVRKFKYLDYIKIESRTIIFAIIYWLFSYVLKSLYLGEIQFQQVTWYFTKIPSINKGILIAPRVWRTWWKILHQDSHQDGWTQKIWIQGRKNESANVRPTSVGIRDPRIKNRFGARKLLVNYRIKEKIFQTEVSIGLRRTGRQTKKNWRRWPKQGRGRQYGEGLVTKGKRM